MELYVYDLDFNYRGILDENQCSSIIWTTNFYDCDEFEIRMPYFDGIFDFIKQDNFIRQNNSDRAMIIEKIYITQQFNNGQKMPVVKIAGRGVESLLDRRVSLDNKTYSGAVDYISRRLVIENIISPSNATRKIDVVALGSYPALTGNYEQLTLGQNIGELTRLILKEQKLGSYLKTDFSNKKMLYTIYAGKDRTQANMNKVEFSPDLDNFSQIEYYSDAVTQYNICLAKTGPDVNDNWSIVPGSNENLGSGTKRREMWADLSNYDVSGAGSASAVDKLISPLAEQELAKKITEETITGNIIDGIVYKFGIDYQVGDTVVLNDGYGHKVNMRLVQMIEYYENGKRTLSPTFENV